MKKICTLLMVLSSFYQARAQCPYSFTASVTQVTGVSKYGCRDGTVTVSVNTTNSVTFIAAYTSTPGANYGGQGLDPQGTITGLSAGPLEIIVVPSPGDNYLFENCAITLPNVVIPGPQFSETTTISVQDATGYGCANGALNFSTITNACDGFDAYLTNSLGQIWHLGRHPSGANVQVPSLAPADYTLFVAGLTATSPTDSTEYPFTVNVPVCSTSITASVIPANNPGCSNGRIAINGIIDDCNGHLISVKRDIDDAQLYSSVNTTNILDQVIPFDFPVGAYRVNVSGLSPGGCTWNSGVVTMDCVIPPVADSDGDGVEDSQDNCPTTYNPDQGRHPYYVDADGDGYGSNNVVWFCNPGAPVGYSVNFNDCNDNDANVNPGASELCANAIDDNCDTRVDESNAYCNQWGGVPTTDCGCDCPPGTTGPNCALIYPCQASMPVSISVTPSPTACREGSITIIASTGNPTDPNYQYGATAYVGGTNTFPVAGGVANWGQPVVLTNLAPGEYGVVVNQSNPDQACVRYFNVVVPGPALALEVSSQVSDVSSFGCADGTVTVTATTTACGGYSFYLRSGTGVDYYPASSNISSGTSSQISGLKAGNYTLYVLANTDLPNSNWIPYPITIGQPACTLTASATTIADGTCANGKLLINAATNDCMGLSVNVRNNSNVLVYSNTFTSSISDLQVQFPEGDYRVHLKGLSPGGCTFTSTLLTLSCAQTTVDAPTVTIVQQPDCNISTGSIDISAPLATGMSYSIGGAYQTSTSFTGLLPNTYQVTAMNSSGTISVATEVVINPVPIITAPVVTGPANVCQYVGTGSLVEFSIMPDPNITSYTWTVPAFTNIVSGQGTGTLAVTFANGFIDFSSKQIRVTGTYTCGTTPMAIKYLTAQKPIVPSSISGPTNVCELIGLASMATYSVPLVPGASEYNWTLPAGVNLVNDNGNSIDVTFDNTFVPSYIAVNSGNECGVSNNRSLYVNKINPSTPGQISGPTNVCLFKPTASNTAGTQAVYSVALSPGITNYNWTVPAGATITDQSTTPTQSVISVSYSAAFTTGSITVSGSNNCGVSAVRSLRLANLNPSTPSAIDVVTGQNCPGRIVTYSLSGMPANATDLVWTVPAGGSINSGQGTTSIEVSYDDGAITGIVSVVAFNGCASSGVRKLSVKLAGCPAAAKGVVRSMPSTSGEEVEILDAGIFPNPSTSEFRLKVKTTAKENIQVRVFDATGVAHSKMIVAPGETISFGKNLKAGVYFVEVTQGRERKVERIVKL